MFELELIEAVAAEVGVWRCFVAEVVAECRNVIKCDQAAKRSRDGPE